MTVATAERLLWHYGHTETKRLSSGVYMFIGPCIPAEARSLADRVADWDAEDCERAKVLLRGCDAGCPCHGATPPKAGEP